MLIANQDALLLRIFLGEGDRAGHRPLYEALVMEAKEMGLAGATVLRGPMGFGHASTVHTAKILRLSDDLPMVVEIVDQEDRIRPYLDAVMPLITSGLVTLEKAHIVHYGPGPSRTDT